MNYFLFIDLLALFILNTLPVFFAEHTEEELIASVLIGEAGGEKPGGMEAVYEVICNRGLKYKKSRREIVLQPKQFSCFNTSVDGAIRRAKKHPKWAKALEISRGKPGNLTGGAIHYANTNIIVPSWSKGMTQTAKIHNHTFWK